MTDSNPYRLNYPTDESPIESNLGAGNDGFLAIGQRFIQGLDDGRLGWVWYSVWSGSSFQVVKDLLIDLGASLEEAQVEQVGYLRSFAEGLTDCPCAWRQPDKNKAGKPCPIVGNFQAVNSPQNQPILWIELTLWVLLFFSVQKGIPKNPRAEFSRPWILASSLPSCNPISSWVGLS